MPIPNEHDLIAQIKGLKKKLSFLEKANAEEFNSTEFNLIKLNLELEKSRRASSIIETRYNLIYAQPYLGIVYFDNTKKIIGCNDRFTELIGHPKEEILEKEIGAIFEKEQISTSIQKAVAGLSSTFEGKYKNNKEKKDIHLRGYFLGTTQGSTSHNLNAGIFEDISEIKQIEYKYDLLTHSFKNISECVVITNSKNKIVFVNNAFLKLYGYTSNEIIGNDLSVIRAVNTKKKVNDIIYKSKSSLQSWKGTLLHTKKDGSEFPVSLSLMVVKNYDNTEYTRICIISDITEEKEIEAELIKAKTRAEQSDKLKSKFLGQISHEIRTPVNIIINVSNMILEDLYYTADNETKAAFAILDSAGKRIIRTIDLILDISAVQACSYNCTFKRIDLFAYTYNSYYQKFKKIATEKNLKFLWKKETNNTFVTVDSYSLLQIFSNILHNSLQYTNSGEIEVLFSENGNKNLTVDFKDTGIGISDDFLPKIFDTFSQEESGNTRKYEGNGLGLALAKAYCNVNNIQIKVYSKKGYGTIFSLIFPKL